MKKKSTFLTFVVPTFNVADYLDQCIGSLLNQTEQAFKVILVDDGSTDGRTKEMCMQYSRTYPDKIRAVFQQNKGLGGARNTGLSLVESNYVMFLDSDDFINLSFVECLKRKLSKSTNEKYDIIFTMPSIYDNQQKRFTEWYDNAVFLKIFDGYSAKVPVIDKELFSLEVSSCSKVFRTDFLKGLNFKYEEHLKYEDFFPHFYLLYHAQSCIGLTECSSFYYRINRPNQLTSRKDSSRLDVVKVISRTIGYAISNEFDRDIVRRILNESIRFSIWCISNSEQDIRNELIRRLNNLYKVLPKEIVNDFIIHCNSRKFKYFLRLIRHRILSNIFRDYLLIEIAKEKFRRRKG